MTKKVTTELFIENAQRIHKNKYDYSKTKYLKAREKVIITCPKHGDFLQTPNSHLNGNGCPRCKDESTGDRCRLTTEIFIDNSKKIHGELYNYSKVNYKGNKEKVEIICQTHGSFWQYPGNHLKGCGCPECKGNRISKTKTSTKEEFIEKAIAVHGNKYDYSKVNYIRSTMPVEIICKKHNTSFWQDPGNHLQGKGCPICNSSKLESLVRENLYNNNINYEEQKTWDWLVYRTPQRVDFFLPDYNLVIECQGIQHFEEVKFFGGKENLVDVINRDKNKQKLCIEHGFSIIYVSNLGEDYPYPYEVININNLINKINASLTN